RQERIDDKTSSHCSDSHNLSLTFNSIEFGVTYFSNETKTFFQYKLVLYFYNDFTSVFVCFHMLMSSRNIREIKYLIHDGTNGFILKQWQSVFNKIVRQCLFIGVASRCKQCTS